MYISNRFRFKYFKLQTHYVIILYYIIMFKTQNCFFIVILIKNYCNLINSYTNNTKSYNILFIVF